MNNTPAQPSRSPWVWLGTGLGLGFAPVAPGTFGSLLGPPLVWAFQQTQLPLAANFAFAVGLFLIGGPICTRSAVYFGKKDPGQVVFDEIAAFAVVYLFLPVTVWTALLGFGWFRLFDIWKPWPIKRFERFPDGWGVMADDTVAGVYAAAFLWLTVWLFDLV